MAIAGSTPGTNKGEVPHALQAGKRTRNKATSNVKFPEKLQLVRVSEIQATLALDMVMLTKRSEVCPLVQPLITTTLYCRQDSQERPSHTGSFKKMN